MHVILGYFSVYSHFCLLSVCLSSGPKEALGISTENLEPGRVELSSESPSSRAGLRMEWQRQSLLFLHPCSRSGFLLLVASALGLHGGLLKAVLLRTWGPGVIEGMRQGLRAPRTQSLIKNGRCAISSVVSS